MNEEIELDEINIIAKVPKNAARVTISAIMLTNDDSQMTVHKVLDPDDIRQARQDFLDYVEGGDDYDARYVITDAGRAYLEQLEKERD